MPKFAPVYMHGHGYDGTDFTLTDVTLNATTFANGAPDNTLIGAIQSPKADSTFAVVDPVDGRVKMNNSDLLVGPTPSAAGPLNVTIREINDYGEGSPHDTVIALTVT